MKVRPEFVTNSSSSSFILGIPRGNTVTTKDAKKYLKEVAKNIGADSIYHEHIIDLRYDKDKEYDRDEIALVVEAIAWYTYKERKKEDPDGYYSDDIIWFIDDTGEYHEINSYQDYTREEIKGIMKYAYDHFGEVLVGSNEMAFYPYEAYDNFIRYNDSIKYKSNHMG